MKLFNHNITPKEVFTDITSIIEEDIKNANMKSGLVIIYTKHTTACLRILEKETLLKQDMLDFMERLASSNCLYRHDDIEKRDVPPDERRNGYSHLRAMMLNNQEIIPVINSELQLGKWQKIFYIECDLGKTNRTFNVLIYEDQIIT